MHTQITAVALTAFDPDELRETVRGSDFEHVQLSPGPFRGSLLRGRFGDSTLDAGRYSRDLLVRGPFPENCVVLGFILAGHEAGYLNGMRLAARDIVVIAEGGGMEPYKLPAQTQWIAFQTRRDLLEREGIVLPARSRIVRYSGLSPEAVQLGRALERLITPPFGLQTAPTQGLLGHGLHLEDALIAEFRRAIDASQGDRLRAHRLLPQRRAGILKKFEEIIESHLSRDLRIPEICSQLGFSQRTLEYVCHDYCGMPPRRYLTVRRLNAVRDSLLNPVGDGNSIAAIARRFRFSHLGRFAQQYRDLFGELPTTTRRERFGRALCLG